MIVPEGRLKDQQNIFTSLIKCAHMQHMQHAGKAEWMLKKRKEHENKLGMDIDLITN